MDRGSTRKAQKRLSLSLAKGIGMSRGKDAAAIIPVDL